MGHELMHTLHPIHFFGSVTTASFSSLWIAPVGHTFKHAASSHCMHMTGTDISASSKWITLTAKFEQTDSQVPQFLHFLGEIINILLIIILVTASAIPVAPPLKIYSLNLSLSLPARIITLRRKFSTVENFLTSPLRYNSIYTGFFVTRAATPRRPSSAGPDLFSEAPIAGLCIKASFSGGTPIPSAKALS